MERFAIKDWRTEAHLIQDVSELPQWFDNVYCYIDFETTSGIDKVASINPWHSCKILGIAIVVDDEQFPLYIPLRHRGDNTFKNLPIEPVMRWLQRVIFGSAYWVNHNIKYDAHVGANEGLEITCELIDTLTLCKLAPREEQFQYNLAKVMSDWYYHNIDPYEESMYLHLPRGYKDYGIIPIDKMCVYAAVDVLSVRFMYACLRDEIPEECNRVVALERQVTAVTYEMERQGMTLDTELLDKHAGAFPVVLMAIQRQLESTTSFPNFRPHTNADCKGLIVDSYGLPVLEHTDKGAPSFGADTILAYKKLRPDLEGVWDWILKYKELYKLYTSFTTPYQDLKVGNVIHCDYDQLKRTGRMSCRKPNMQQLSPAAKEYIVPSATDRVIVDIDFSQIEFRLIAHFIKAQGIINAYNQDPDTDYHSRVADMVGIDRYPAKRVNFMLGYGGGRGKCIEILSSIPSIIGELKNRDAIEAKANGVFERYHKMVPTLRPTTYHASAVMRQRGYVRTLLKRRRYLPRRAHFKAFNTIIQGSAADLMKAALVRVADYLNSKPDIHLIGCVHDSIVIDMPKSYVLKEVPILVSIVEELPEDVELRIPLRADAQWSSLNWNDKACPVEF